MDDTIPSRAEAEARRPYPWVYRASFKTRMRFVLPLAGALALGGLAYWWAGQGSAPIPLAPRDVVELAVVGLAAAALLVVTISVLLYQVVLTRDAVRRRGLFGWRTLRRDQIAGFCIRQWDSSGFARLILRPRPGQGRALTLILYDQDDDLIAWLEGLHNEDAARIEATVARAEATWWLGRDKDARPQNLARLSAVAYLATMAVVVLSVLTLFLHGWLRDLGLPKDAFLIVLAVFAAIPLLAMTAAALARGLFRLAPTGRPELRPLLGGLVVMPALVLGGQGLDRADPVELGQVLAAAAAGATLLWALAWLIDRRGMSNLWVAALMWLAFFAYGYGVVMLADVELDRARPAQSVGSVVGKTPRDRRHVWVAFQADRPVVRKVSVNARGWRVIQLGEPACVLVHPGRLGLAWFKVYRCVSRLPEPAQAR